MHHAYSRSPKIPYAQHYSMTLYPACFSTNHSLYFAGEQDTSGTTL